MASSNRHWPSLFKSKPCNTHHQWQHDINPSSLLSTACQKLPFTSAPSGEERSPEPKPRWNPKPEQIRILEAIFNSGMVNPPRDEIRKIRSQLQEYGQVGDANVFYWFQNRKSRSKHKLRHLQSSRQQIRSAATSAAPTATSTINTATPTSSSSSSSDRSSISDKAPPPTSVAALTGALDSSASPTASVNQTYFQGPMELCGEPLFFQAPHGYCYSAAAGEIAGIVAGPEQGLGVFPGLWTELIMGQEGSKGGEEEARVRMQLHYGYGIASASVASTNASAIATTTTVTSVASVACATPAAAGFLSPANEIQGPGGMGVGATRSIVFINEVAFEVAAVPLNLKEAFGEEAVLLNSSGHPVQTDEWGLTLQPLQHGASYYLV